MIRILLSVVLTVLLTPFAEASSKGYSRSTSTHSSKSHSTRPAKPKAQSAKHGTRCTSCARDSKGRIARSTTAKHDFQKSHPCPSTGKTTGPCKGYVIDHVVPLKRGGADAPSNMQWQTVQAAKAKDKVE